MGSNQITPFFVILIVGVIIASASLTLSGQFSSPAFTSPISPGQQSVTSFIDSFSSEKYIQSKTNVQVSGGFAFPIGPGGTGSFQSVLIPTYTSISYLLPTWQETAAGVSLEVSPDGTQWLPAQNGQPVSNYPSDKDFQYRVAFSSSTQLDWIKFQWKTTAPSTCGDGTRDSGEECDDGNTQNGDGCSSVCVIEGKTAYWPLDADAQDKVNTNHGTLQGNPQFVQGKIGNALQTDGVDDYVSINPITLPIYPDGTYTIAFWVKASSGQSDKKIYSEGSSTDGDTLFILSTATSETSKMRVFIRDDSGTAFLSKQTVATVFDNNWHHVAFVDSNGQASVYIDGIKDVTDFSYTRASLTLNKVALAAQFKSSPSGFFAGVIDDPRVYSRPLNSQEIAWLAGQSGGSYCGDGKTDAGEQCDDGNTNNCDACTNQCKIYAPACGNSCPDSGEQCDDGNLNSCDGCDSLCRSESCGNNRRECSEECDGTDNSACTSGVCLSDCTCQGGGGDVCGDSICGPTESCSSCPSDCGSCGGGDMCGDALCGPLENPTTCPSDCQIGSKFSCETAANLTGSSGKIWWVDPVTGKDGNPGTKTQPWKKLGNVADSGNFTASGKIKAGDVVCMLDGDHDGDNDGGNDVWVWGNGNSYSSPVRIMAQVGQKNVRMGHLTIDNIDNLIIDGIRVSPTFATNPYTNGEMVKITGPAITYVTTDITLQNSELFTATDAETNGWSLTEWQTKLAGGIKTDVGGGVQRTARVSIISNYIHNVGDSAIDAISLQGPGSVARGNKVDRFSVDCVKINGAWDASYGGQLIEKNVCTNVMDIDGYHVDGVQIYVASGFAKGTVIRENIFISNLDHSRPHSPGVMQGIANFGSGKLAEDMLIENNIVNVDHHHGITLQGNEPGSCVIGNTVVGYIRFDNNNNDGDQIDEGWSSTPIYVPTDPSVVVWNNIATRFALASGSNQQFNRDVDDRSLICYDRFGNPSICDDDGNGTVVDYFVDFRYLQKSDLHLKPTAEPVDKGSGSVPQHCKDLGSRYPVIDVENDARPKKNGYDIGADEVK